MLSLEKIRFVLSLMKQLLFICNHFYEAFRKKHTLRNLQLFRQFKLKEVIGFCSECFNEKIKKCFVSQSNLSEESSFKEARNF